MKISMQTVKVAVAVAIPVAVTTGYIIEQSRKIHALAFRSNYFEEKLDSVLTMLTPEQLEKLDEEVSADIQFYSMARTTLKDTL